MMRIMTVMQAIADVTPTMIAQIVAYPLQPSQVSTHITIALIAYTTERTAMAITHGKNPKAWKRQSGNEPTFIVIYPAANN